MDTVAMAVAVLTFVALVLERFELVISRAQSRYCQLFDLLDVAALYYRLRGRPRDARVSLITRCGYALAT